MGDLESKSEILEKVRAKRGYLLSYHELFWRLDPGLLEKYDQFYTEVTLKTKFLDNSLDKFGLQRWFPAGKADNFGVCFNIFNYFD